MSEKKDIYSHFREFSKETEKEKNGHPHPYLNEEYEGMEWEDEEEEHALTDELDHEILMHRDAHFGGDFKVMLDYYLNDHIGVEPDFEIERIKYLAEIEHQLEKNLAPMLLTGPEAERVAKARQAYKLFKDLYEGEDDSIVGSHLIADLILSEEEEPENAIQAIVQRGSDLVPSLIDIVQSDEAYDPLFPGYGYAPYLAILCLGKIGDSQAIVPIFEVLSRETHFGEEVILEALLQIGENAKKFLLKLLATRPLTQDNVHAAFALTAFLHDEAVARIALHELENPEVREKPLLAIYLLCCCETLKNPSDRAKFIQIAENPSISIDFRKEMQKIIMDWQSQKSKN